MTKTDEQNMIVPVCVRDGEEIARIIVAGVEFQMGVSELGTIIRCTMMDICNASGPTQRALGHFPLIALQVCDLICCLGTPGRPADDECNRQRWADTGIGGVQDLATITAKLAAIDEAHRLILSARNATELWKAEQAKFAARGQRLFDPPAQPKTNQPPTPRPTNKIG